MSDWPVEIDGWEYHPIPQNWLEAGRDETAPDGPQCLAVSVCRIRPGTLKIRYAHPEYDTVGETYTRADQQSRPDPQGRPWSRSIGASALNPCGVLRMPERRHLRDLWSDRVDALQDDDQLVADGGEREPPGAFVDDWRERHGLDEDDGGESA